jgi:hypothetical protein
MNKTIRLFFVLSTTAIFFLGACSKIVYTHDVPNLHQVNDSFYRSGQVTTLAGWKYLHDQLGVTDDFKLDFENEGSDDLARIAGITVHVLSIEPSTNPDGIVEVTGAVLMRPAPDRIAELKRLVREVVDDNV